MDDLIHDLYPSLPSHALVAFITFYSTMGFYHLGIGIVAAREMQASGRPVDWLVEFWLLVYSFIFWPVIMIRSSRRMRP